MNTLDYSQLCYEEKRELLRNNGSFISERRHNGEGRRTLYALYDFYVEVVYDVLDHERYLRVMEDYFTSQTRLEGISIVLN